MLCRLCNDKRLGPERKKRKVTGEWELFKQIWKNRPHICTNCGGWLGDEPQPCFFSHIKGKGAHPELRLSVFNIQLLCFECHRVFDQGTKAEFEKRNINNRFNN